MQHACQHTRARLHARCTHAGFLRDRRACALVVLRRAHAPRTVASPKKDPPSSPTTSAALRAASSAPLLSRGCIGSFCPRGFAPLSACSSTPPRNERWCGACPRSTCAQCAAAGAGQRREPPRAMTANPTAKLASKTPRARHGAAISRRHPTHHRRSRLSASIRAETCRPMIHDQCTFLIAQVWVSNKWPGPGTAGPHRRRHGRDGRGPGGDTLRHPQGTAGRHSALRAIPFRWR